MRVMVSATGGSVDSPVDQRFGRAPFFIIIDTENEENAEVIQNPFAFAPNGAGISAAQFALEKGVQAVISGAFGPNSSMILQSSGIQMIYEPEPIPVKEAIKKLKNETYTSQPQPQVQYTANTPYGMVFGRGFGFGAPFFGGVNPFWGGFFSEEKFIETRISMLKNELEFLEKRLSEIKKAKEEK